MGGAAAAIAGVAVVDLLVFFPVVCPRNIPPPMRCILPVGSVIISVGTLSSGGGGGGGTSGTTVVAIAGTATIGLLTTGPPSVCCISVSEVSESDVSVSDELVSVSMSGIKVGRDSV